MMKKIRPATNQFSLPVSVRQCEKIQKIKFVNFVKFDRIREKSKIILNYFKSI